MPAARASAHERQAKIADLLHEAAETNRVVYRIVDGDYPDLDRDYTAEPRDERREDWYAERLLAQFGAAPA